MPRKTEIKESSEGKRKGLRGRKTQMETRRQKSRLVFTAYVHREGSETVVEKQ